MATLTSDMMQDMISKIADAMPKHPEIFVTSILPGMECRKLEAKDRTYISLGAYHALKNESATNAKYIHPSPLTSYMQPYFGVAIQDADAIVWQNLADIPGAFYAGVYEKQQDIFTDLIALSAHVHGDNAAQVIQDLMARRPTTSQTEQEAD